MLFVQLPENSEMVDYLAYIHELPVNDMPGLFGLHENADISCAQAATYASLDVLLGLQPRVVGVEARSQDEETKSLAKSLLEKVPQPFQDIEAIKQRLVQYIFTVICPD